MHQRSESGRSGIRLVAVFAILAAVGAFAMCSRQPAPVVDEIGAAAPPPPSSFACAVTRGSPKVQYAGGLTVLCDDVYAENGLDERQLSELRRARELAASNLLRTFESLRSSPFVIFCRTTACKVAFGASPRAAAAEDLGFASAQVMIDDGGLVPSAVVVTGPVPRTALILTHELIHAEMKAWASYDSLPTWFNEGTATFIAGEPSCEGVPPLDVDVTRLDSKTRWQEHLQKTRKTRETYCAARGEVEKWMKRFDGDHARADALKTLMTSVARGTSFDQAFVAAR